MDTIQWKKADGVTNIVTAWKTISAKNHLVSNSIRICILGILVKFSLEFKFQIVLLCNKYRPHNLAKQGGNIFDKCCGKINLFRVQNRVVHILSWWECCQVYQTEGLFHERWSNSWLFWYQMYGKFEENKCYTILEIIELPFSNLQRVNFRTTSIYHGIEDSKMRVHAQIFYHTSWVPFIANYFACLNDIEDPIFINHNFLFNT